MLELEMKKKFIEEEELLNLNGMELTKKSLETIVVRGNMVLLHGVLRKLASGILTSGGDHVDMDMYDIEVIKCGPLVTDLKAGDKVILSNLSVEPLPIKECPDLQKEFYGYTPESFIKLYIRDENSSKE